MKITTIGTFDLIYPVEKQTAKAKGLRFVVKETPHSPVGKFHGQICLIQQDGSDGIARFGDYFSSAEAACEKLNTYLEKVPSGAILTEKVAN